MTCSKALSALAGALFLCTGCSNEPTDEPPTETATDWDRLTAAETKREELTPEEQDKLSLYDKVVEDLQKMKEESQESPAEWEKKTKKMRKVVDDLGLVDVSAVDVMQAVSKHIHAGNGVGIREISYETNNLRQWLESKDDEAKSWLTDSEHTSVRDGHGRTMKIKLRADTSSSVVATVETLGKALREMCESTQKGPTTLSHPVIVKTDDGWIAEMILTPEADQPDNTGKKGPP